MTIATQMEVGRITIAIYSTDDREWDDKSIEQIDDDAFDIDFAGIIADRMRDKGYSHFEVKEVSDV